MSRGVRRNALVKASERRGKKRPVLLGVNERLFAFRRERNDSFTVMSVRSDELPNIDDIRCLAAVPLLSRRHDHERFCASYR
jgi:hypothetical protein